MRALGTGEVIASYHPGLFPGDHVTGLLGVQEYAVADGNAMMKVDPKLAPLPVYLGALGMPGMTAYSTRRSTTRARTSPPGFASTARTGSTCTSTRRRGDPRRGPRLGSPDGSALNTQRI
jgi:NADPH-dependent curcumin reductase CurA